MEFQFSIISLFLIFTALVNFAFANTNLFVEQKLTDDLVDSIASQLESMSKLQCLHKCKRMKDKCSDVIFERASNGYCVLLKTAGDAGSGDTLEDTLTRLGISDGNNGIASLAKLPGITHFNK